MVSIGPGILERDRLDYSDAMSDSWEQQMLKNIVKLRYRESVFFLEVASVINQYTVEGTARAAVTPGSGDDDIIGGSGRYADRPTITYAPLRGKDFVRQMLAPVSPTVLFILAQSGWPIDRMFELTVRKVNGIANTSLAGVNQLPDPEFAELMQIFRKLQGSRALDMRMVRLDDGLEHDQAQVILSLDSIPDDLLADAQRAAEILRIEPINRKFLVTYGGVGAGPEEIAVLSRSVMEIMAEFGETITVPHEHIESGVYQRESL